MGDNKARVRKSSGGTLGAVKLEKDLAADLMACSDAVRLDLNDVKRSVEEGNVDAMRAMSDASISCFPQPRRNGARDGRGCSLPWAATK